MSELSPHVRKKIAEQARLDCKAGRYKPPRGEAEQFEYEKQWYRRRGKEDFKGATTFRSNREEPYGVLSQFLTFNEEGKISANSERRIQRGLPRGKQPERCP
jgi:hypothetical protein